MESIRKQLGQSNYSQEKHTPDELKKFADVLYGKAPMSTLVDKDSKLLRGRVLDRPLFAPPPVRAPAPDPKPEFYVTQSYNSDELKTEKSTVFASVKGKEKIVKETAMPMSFPTEVAKKEMGSSSMNEIASSARNAPDNIQCTSASDDVLGSETDSNIPMSDTTATVSQTKSGSSSEANRIAGFDPNFFGMTDPGVARDTMQRKFDKWAQKQRAGIDMIPFSDMGAAPDAHRALTTWGSEYSQGYQKATGIVSENTLRTEEEMDTKNDQKDHVIKNMFEHINVEDDEEYHPPEHGEGSQKNILEASSLEKMGRRDDVDQDVGSSKGADVFTEAQQALQDPAAGTKLSRSERRAAAHKAKGKDKDKVFIAMPAKVTASGPELEPEATTSQEPASSFNEVAPRVQLYRSVAKALPNGDLDPTNDEQALALLHFMNALQVHGQNQHQELAGNVDVSY